MTEPPLIRETKNGLSFDIHVNPHASRAGIAGLADGMLKVKVTAPPVEGAANDACIGLISKKLGLRKSQMTIQAGAHGRKKTILVTDISKAELEQRIRKLDISHP
ncbi:MAG: YggU family protein [Deltaproteobacteria bacterium]|nr:YggU family protein [Deltaproteobacteria bacterium]